MLGLAAIGAALRSPDPALSSLTAGLEPPSEMRGRQTSCSCCLWRRPGRPMTRPHCAVGLNLQSSSSVRRGGHRISRHQHWTATLCRAPARRTGWTLSRSWAGRYLPRPAPYAHSIARMAKLNSALRWAVIVESTYCVPYSLPSVFQQAHMRAAWPRRRWRQGLS